MVHNIKDRLLVGECKNVSVCCMGFVVCVLPPCLLLCGTAGIAHFATKTMPKYYNYKDEERHHIVKTCSNITSQMKGMDEFFFFLFFSFLV